MTVQSDINRLVRSVGYKMIGGRAAITIENDEARHRFVARHNELIEQLNRIIRRRDLYVGRFSQGNFSALS
jgi:hypothetical protein